MSDINLVNREIASIIINFILPLRKTNRKDWDKQISPDSIMLLAVWRSNNFCSAQEAKEVVNRLWNRIEASELDIIEEFLETKLNSGSGQSIEDLVKLAIAQEKQASTDYRAGKPAAMSRLMGAAMKLAGKQYMGKEIKQEMERQLR